MSIRFVSSRNHNAAISITDFSMRLVPTSSVIESASSDTTSQRKRVFDAAGVAARTVLERSGRIGAARLPRRECRRRSPPRRAPPRALIPSTRTLHCGCDEPHPAHLHRRRASHQADGPRRDDRAGDASDRGERGHLEDDLARDVAAARAKREPQRVVAPPHRAAREHERGDVGARDQEYAQRRTDHRAVNILQRKRRRAQGVQCARRTACRWGGHTTGSNRSMSVH